jgi:murein DD-endopeptidase MepM/ murein hydrolase activator NlpD
MIAIIWRAVLSATLGAAALGSALCSTAIAASPEEERLLGCGCEDTQLLSYLPFSRSIGVNGAVKGSLAESTAAAGVSPAIMLEVLDAFATAIDLERDVRDGDRFYVRYERMFTLEGTPIGVGRVLWAELRTQAKGTLSIHRFRPAKGEPEAFWFANGTGTGAAIIHMPLKNISVASGFGLRADPFDQPWARTVPMGPIAGPGPGGTGNWPQANWKPKTTTQSPLKNPATIQPSPLGSAGATVNTPTPLGIAMGLAPAPARAFGGFKPAGNGGGGLFMHEGVDLVAALGTPIMAAADGIVLGAEPRGRYGNWIEIQHNGNLATVYGHLSAFAPGIAAGVHVEQGDIIGFTGQTGRVTGPHLHFELLVNGRPTNPIGHPATRHGQLRGPEMVLFKKVVARDLAERERESKAM